MSLAATEAEVIAKRKALQDSLAQLRGRLAPAELAKDLNSGVSSKLAVVSDVVSDKASSPAGLVGLCAMAFASAYALTGSLKESGSTSSATKQTEPLTPRGSPALRGDILAAMGQLSAAVAVGAVVSKYLPATDAERSLLAGVGPELRNIIHKHVSQQAELLVSPPSNKFSLVNLVALGGAMLLQGKR